MDLVVELTRERGMSTILITHDLGLAATYCDRIVVMEKGKVVETAMAETIFRAPEHAYTQKLMRATPRPGVTLRDLLPADAPIPQTASTGAPLTQSGELLLEVVKLVKEYPRQGGAMAKLLGRKHEDPAAAIFRAVDGISFDMRRGESVGLVGRVGLRASPRRR